MIFKIFESLYNFMDKKGAKTKYERVSHYWLQYTPDHFSHRSIRYAANIRHAAIYFWKNEEKIQTQTRDFSGIEKSVPKYYRGVG